MASLPELRYTNQKLYEELRENFLELCQDEKKKESFVRKVGDFLEAVQEAEPRTRSINEYEWLNRTNVNWHSAITNTLGILMEIKTIPLPEHINSYEPALEAEPLAPEIERLPLAIAIGIARKVVAKIPEYPA